LFIAVGMCGSRLEWSPNQNVTTNGWIIHGRRLSAKLKLRTN